MSAAEHKWYIEQTTPSTAHMFGLENYIVCQKTAFQQVEIVDNPLYGRMLILDGKIQSAAFDEYIYHEALVQPAMLLHESPRRIFIAGGGEGATLREIFRHPQVEKVVMADIDGGVIDLCRKYLEEWHRGSFDDPRLELVIADARRYLEENEELFDVAIIDIPEPVEKSPALKLFTRQFYALLKRRLAKGGVVALQAGDFSTAFLEAHCAIYQTIRQAFPFAYSYSAFVPSFNTSWSFIIATPDSHPRGVAEGLITRRIEERGLPLRFYDEETHRGIFCVPKDIRKIRDDSTTIIDDDQLLTTY
ncbi:MAG: fused MFS/spermidine synthase [Firmicutes bacterium]|nr:fused MFS/spermidine synthase [Bacillota bacterium]